MRVKSLLLLLALSFSLCLTSCEDDDSSSNDPIECGTHNGKQLYKGPEGGCYYMNSNGNKTYVDRSECDC